MTEYYYVGPAPGAECGCWSYYRGPDGGRNGCGYGRNPSYGVCLTGSVVTN